MINLKSLVSTVSTKDPSNETTSGLGLKFFGSCQPIDFIFRTKLDHQTASDSNSLDPLDNITFYLKIDGVDIAYFQYQVPQNKTYTLNLFGSAAASGNTSYVGTGKNGARVADGDWQPTFRGPVDIGNYPDDMIIFGYRSSNWPLTANYQKNGQDGEATEAVEWNNMIILRLSYYYNASGVKTRGWIRHAQVAYNATYSVLTYSLDIKIAHRFSLRSNDDTTWNTRKLQLYAQMNRNTAFTTHSSVKLSGFFMQLVYLAQTPLPPPTSLNDNMMVSRSLTSKPYLIANWNLNRSLEDSINGFVGERVIWRSNSPIKFTRYPSSPNADSSLETSGKGLYALQPNRNSYNLVRRNIASSPPLVLPGNFTISFWFFHPGNVAWMEIFVLETVVDNKNFAIYTNQFTPNGICWGWPGGWANFTYKVGSWNNIVIVSRAGDGIANMSMYNNGTLISSDCPHISFNQIKLVGIGQQAPGSTVNDADLIIRDIRIYNRDLSAYEITEEYDYGRPA